MSAYDDDAPTRSDLARDEADAALDRAERTGDFSHFTCRECGYVAASRADVEAPACPQCGARGEDR